MTTIGYAAMLEQFHPTELLDWCAQAEAAGFEAGFMVSEHFHPWTPQQGQSAFAWTFMGALGARTTLRFGTGVTCPTFRYHPAVVAQAAATLGAMYPDRFWLGLGAGEALNEHIVGGKWPEVGVRSSMMF
jgi:coenzyme F420-dependent glucose-6-phosphate dehydrogenase